MSEQQRDIARKILASLYDAWERHTIISLNPVQEQGRWDISVFRTVVEKLENQGLIKSHGSSYTFEITPHGITRAQETEAIPKDKVKRHEKIRQHILAFLADLYDREGSRADVHYEKIAEEAPVNNRMEILNDLVLLKDLGYVEAASTSSFTITDKGLRYYRGADYDEII